MIIPVRCMTCGKVLANKWNYFKKKKNAAGDEDKPETDTDGFYSRAMGDILDELGLKRICCRRHMLCHVDLIDEI